MNKTIRNVLLTASALAFVVCLGCIATSASAQVAATPPADTPAVVAPAMLETAGAVAQPFIVTFAQSHAWLLSVLAAIGTLRIVFKPLTAVATAWVQSTASTRDDEILATVEHSAAYKVVAWLIDYLGSIKVGPQKPAAK